MSSLKDFLKRRNKAKSQEAEDEKLDQKMMLINTNNDIKKYLENVQKRLNEAKEPQSEIETKKTKPERKLGNIMKINSYLKKEGDKYIVDTDISIEELDIKTKKALIKSIVDNLNDIFDDHICFYDKKN